MPTSSFYKQMSLPHRGYLLFQSYSDFLYYLLYRPGVIFCNNLSWSHHYELISSRAYRQLGLIRRTFSSDISTKVKKLLYLSLVRSKLTYCSQVWRPRLIKDISSLERIQRRATKYITRDYSFNNYKDRLVALHILPLM